MTDEEKAEESLEKRKGECWCIKTDNVYTPYTEGYKDGLEEGKKVGFDEGYKKATERAYERQQDLTNTYIKDGEKIKQLEKEIVELNNQLYDLKESYNMIIDEVIETAKGYGLISETCLWQYINEYDNKEITYDELYERLLSVAVQELSLSIVDMKKRL